MYQIVLAHFQNCLRAGINNRNFRLGWERALLLFTWTTSGFQSRLSIVATVQLHSLSNIKTCAICLETPKHQYKLDKLNVVGAEPWRLQTRFGSVKAILFEIFELVSVNPVSTATCLNIRSYMLQNQIKKTQTKPKVKHSFDLQLFYLSSVLFAFHMKDLSFLSTQLKPNQNFHLGNIKQNYVCFFSLLHKKVNY